MLTTKSGLYFATLKELSQSRVRKFDIVLKEERYFVGQSVTKAVLSIGDSVLICVKGSKILHLLDRDIGIVSESGQLTTLDNPHFNSLIALSDNAGEDIYLYRDKTSISVIDVVSKKALTLFEVPLKFDAVRSQFTDVILGKDGMIQIHALEYESSKTSIKKFDFLLSDLIALFNA